MGKGVYLDRVGEYEYKVKLYMECNLPLYVITHFK